MSSSIKTVKCPKCDGVSHSRGEKYFRCCNNQYVIEEHLYNQDKDKDVNKAVDEIEEESSEDYSTEEVEDSNSSDSPVKIEDIKPEVENTMKNNNQEPEELEEPEKSEEPDSQDWELLNPANMNHRKIIAEEHNIDINKSGNAINELIDKGYTKINTETKQVD